LNHGKNYEFVMHSNPDLLLNPAEENEEEASNITPLKAKAK